MKTLRLHHLAWGLSLAMATPAMAVRNGPGGGGAPHGGGRVSFGGAGGGRAVTVAPRSYAGGSFRAARPVVTGPRFAAPYRGGVAVQRGPVVRSGYGNAYRYRGTTGNWNRSRYAGGSWSGNRNWHGHGNWDHHDGRHHHNYGNRVYIGAGYGWPYYSSSYWPTYSYYSSPYYDYDYDYGYDYGYDYPTYVSQPVYYGVTVVASGPIAARVQRQLARDGYYNGSIDGVVGRRTRAAIAAYQRDHRLPITARVDRSLLRSLGIA